jgi:hypothetical protein
LLRSSATSDSIIFLFLGIALVKGQHVWHTGFIVWTISFCLIVRFIGKAWQSLALAAWHSHI